MKRGNRKTRFLLCLISFIFSCPSAVSAQVIISEIMYDPDGADDGREWVEIYNGGNESIDLSGWSFYEAETNHKLINEDTAVLDAGLYAIIADDAAQFRNEWPSVKALVLDSSFSLRSKDNIGEYIAIRDADKNEIDGFTYQPLEPAGGKGSSLQKINGEWVAALPTPGKANTRESSDNESGSNAESGNQDNGGSQFSSAEGFSFPVEPQIISYAGEDRTVVVGADTEYEGQALGLNKEPLKNARYIWNFGNGSIAEGRKTLYHYEYPGDYVVMLNVSSGEYSASDRIDVKAVSADMIISKVESDFIEIYNRSDKELDLSWWRLAANGEHFNIPKDTIVLSGKKLNFPSSVTSLYTQNTKIASLQYPNGTTAYVFNNVPQVPEIQSVGTVIALQEEVSMPVAQISFDEEENDKSDIEEEVQSDQNASVLAAVGSLDGIAVAKESGGIYKWLLALFGIVSVSAASILFFRKSAEEKDEIKILE